MTDLVFILWRLSEHRHARKENLEIQKRAGTSGRGKPTSRNDLCCFCPQLSQLYRRPSLSFNFFVLRVKPSRASFVALRFEPALAPQSCLGS